MNWGAFFHYSAFLVGMAFGHISDPTANKKEQPEIIFPKLVRNAPKSVPEEVGTLRVDQFYVIQSDKRLLILDSPSGLVSISEDAVPVGTTMKLRGRFVDGTGVETRTYNGDKGPLYLYTVESTGTTGKVEILISSEINRDKTIRKSLSVVGTDPVPIPIPDTKTEFEKTLKAAYDGETYADKALLPKLVTLYTEAGTKATATQTWVGLFAVMNTKAKELGIDGHLLAVKKVISGELGKILPTGDIPANLQIGDKAKDASDAFARVVAALEKVK